MKPLDDLIARITAASQAKTRLVVAIAGAPGSGKSTLVAHLSAVLPDCAVLPMDGFHLDNAVLRARDLLHRKGAPETFDVAGLAGLLARLNDRTDLPVPTFDRALDCTVPGGATIPATARIVLVEGNYLLLDQPGWRELRRFWDLTIMLDVPEAELERRLTQRWLDHGHADADAKRRALGNDMPNARLIRRHSVAPDIVLLDDN